MPFAEFLILASLPTRKPKLGQVTSLSLSPLFSSKRKLGKAASHRARHALLTRKPKLGQVKSPPLSFPLSTKLVAVDSARAMFKPPAARAERVCLSAA